MLIKRKSWALSIGYHIEHDCFGISLAAGRRRNVYPFPGGVRYRLVCGLAFATPKLIWYNKHWALNEPGYIQGQPIMRAKPKKWLLRGVTWYRTAWWQRFD